MEPVNETQDVFRDDMFTKHVFVAPKVILRVVELRHVRVASDVCISYVTHGRGYVTHMSATSDVAPRTFLC